MQKKTTRLALDLGGADVVGVVAVLTESGNGWTLHCCDCLQWMAEQAEGSVDHVICDPPYESEAHTLQRRVKRGPSLKHATDARVAKVAPLSFEPLSFEPLSSELRERGGAEVARLCRRWALVFCQCEATELWRVALEPMAYRRTAVWVKPDAMPQYSGDRPGMGYESIVCCHAKGRSAWNGGGRVGVFVHNKNSGGKHLHETQKPLPLMLDLVRLFTDEGELVCDPFAGSGTTGVACLRLGRRFVGCELDEKYWRVACERLRAEENGTTLQAARAGQLPMFGDTP